MFQIVVSLFNDLAPVLLAPSSQFDSITDELTSVGLLSETMGELRFLLLC